MTIATSSHWQGPCASAQQVAVDGTPHASWDLDVGEATSWWRALQTCGECPVQRLCIERRAELYPGGNPAGVIWAGVPYSETGRVLDLAGLRRLAITRRNQVRRGRPRRESAAVA